MLIKCQISWAERFFSIIHEICRHKWSYIFLLLVKETETLHKLLQQVIDYCWQLHLLTTRCVRLFRNELSFCTLCWGEKERQFLTMLHHVKLLSRNPSFLIFVSLNWPAFMFCCLHSVPSSSAAQSYSALPEVCVKKCFNIVWCQI